MKFYNVLLSFRRNLNNWWEGRRHLLRKLPPFRVGAEKLFGGKKIQFLLTQLASRLDRADVFYSTAFYNPLLSFRRNLNSWSAGNARDSSRMTRVGVFWHSFFSSWHLIAFCCHSEGISTVKREIMKRILPELSETVRDISMLITVTNAMKLLRRSFVTFRNDGLALIGDKCLHGVQGNT